MFRPEFSFQKQQFLHVKKTVFTKNTKYFISALTRTQYTVGSVLE